MESNIEQYPIINIQIEGLVEGVGFRPFVYRIASEMGIVGEVGNSNIGVFVRAKMSKEQCKNFVGRIKTEHPEVAFIYDIKVEESTEYPDFDGKFLIVPSRSISDEVTQVAPDIAVCNDCLIDRQKQPHRLNYPFINCTHCGPRFSIIKDLPYDRASTTMSIFPMCEQCHDEYEDVDDRRFHAQPVACNNCGPTYYAEIENRNESDYSRLLDITSGYINSGDVIAVKGIGGYHLVCNAADENSVRKLREIKKRDTKPFAVMFKDIETLKEYATVSIEEEKEISSWRRPIVLLHENRALATGINPDMKTLGCMLPYMPIHYDWFERLQTPVLVMTSGNLSDCPILITPEAADKELKDKVSIIVHHNRPIYNRVDDSVAQVCGSQLCLIRRSRGYVPEPFFTDVDTEGILAFGAEKVNTFAIGKGNNIIQSQYIGDLKNWETYEFYNESLGRFRHLFRFTPSFLVADLHPDYLSSKKATEVSEEENIPLLRVQHHHAHAVACMLEYGIEEPVIALVLDGTGLGDDGKSWGGEIFHCDRKDYDRLAHLEYVYLPGGDKASTEPWRMAVSYLSNSRIPIENYPDGFVDRIGRGNIELMLRMIDKGVNSPQTSSVGRLFDAVASLLNLCDVMTHQAQAAILLEQIADEEFEECYEYEIINKTLMFDSMISSILKDLKDHVERSRIASRFHNTLTRVLFEQTKYFLAEKKATKVVISGGCFQNKRLTTQLMRMFGKEEIDLYVPGKIPCNDGGIAVGQIAIAAALRQEKLDIKKKGNKNA